ncbi:hypothetical protein B0H14DRAFT_2581419 [Mycena olivaceomarginata]|nr:hypothetical protein B0H14DRAFT_2581419 [Mycena olivaceomarginata]
MDLRRRVIVLTPLLFQLVILRIYLRRSPADDEQIYFLTHIFDRLDPMIPWWCKISIRISKAAAPRIPPNFVLANAFDAFGADYIWSPSDARGIFSQTEPSIKSSIKSPLSSPFSALPPEMGVEPLQKELNPLSHNSRTRKRKRQVDDVGEKEVLQTAIPKQPNLRRSARSKGQNSG